MQLCLVPGWEQMEDPWNELRLWHGCLVMGRPGGYCCCHSSETARGGTPRRKPRTRGQFDKPSLFKIAGGREPGPVLLQARAPRSDNGAASSPHHTGENSFSPRNCQSAHKSLMCTFSLSSFYFSLKANSKSGESPK